MADIQTIMQQMKIDLDGSGVRLSADVMLNKQRPDDLFRIELHYSNIWTVAKGDSTFFTGKNNIYTNPDVLKSNLNQV